MYFVFFVVFFFQAEDGIRDVERSRGLGMCIRDRLPGYLRHLVVRRASKTGEILLALVTTSQVPGQKAKASVLSGLP